MYGYCSLCSDEMFELWWQLLVCYFSTQPNESTTDAVTAAGLSAARPRLYTRHQSIGI